MISAALITDKNVVDLTKKLKPLFRFILWSFAALLAIFLVLNLLYDILQPEHIPDFAIGLYMLTGYSCAYLLIWGIIPCCLWGLLTVIFLRYKKIPVRGLFMNELRPLWISSALILIISIIMIIRDHSTP